MLNRESDEEPQPFHRTEFNERESAFSPDGTWLAFVSDESGRDDVYVAAISDPEKLQCISSNGGHSPRWSPDGEALFYREDDMLMVVSFETVPELSVGEPEVLLPAPSEFTFDISPDSQHFLMTEELEKPSQVYVVLNWFEELKRLVPTEN
jgi:serine/threonine-protein kinase